MNILEIRGLTKDYGDVRAVDNLSLDIEKGEIFALLGPNGAGKTTTIKSILGVIFPTKGEIKINGFDVIKEGRQGKISVISRKGWHSMTISRQSRRWSFTRNSGAQA